MTYEAGTLLCRIIWHTYLCVRLPEHAIQEMTF